MVLKNICGGRALRIAVGITVVLLLMTGGAGALMLINETGRDCISFGTWDAGTMTCTMTTDLNDIIQIESNGVILDGNGHTITIPNYRGAGVALSGRRGVTIKNLNIENGVWGYGVFLSNSSNNYLMGNHVSKVWYGIYLAQNSNNNTLSGNNVSNNNGYGIYLYGSDNTLIGNNANSNNDKGIYLSGSNNMLIRNNANSNNNHGIYLTYSNSNNLISNNASNNTYYGIYMVASNNNTLRSNNASDNRYGISMSGSNNMIIGNNANSNNNGYGMSLFGSNNTLIENNANSNNNGNGIYLSGSDNTLIGNNANSNNSAGISLIGSNGKLSGNHAANNNIGIYLDGSNNTLNSNDALNNDVGISISPFSYNNIIHNNYFKNQNNFLLSYSYSYFNTWNITKTSGMNIIGGPYLGGNFWANPNGTGFSQTCTDADNDGICDVQYTLDSNNIDYLPLTKYAATTIVTVTSPNGEENWQVGTIQTIKWTYTGNLGLYVKIELLKGGVLNRVINSSTSAGSSGSGSYNWLINSTQTMGTDYKIRVTSTTNSAYTDTSNNNFTISTKTPSITVVSPNGTENWRRGTTQTIKWNSSGSLGTYVKIELLKAGILNRVIIASTPNDGTHPWLIPTTQAPGTDYKVRITSTTNSTYNDTSDNNFTIPVPTITVKTPNGGESWIRGTTKIINWSSTESPGSYVKIELLKPGVPNRVIISSTLNDGSHPWLIPATLAPGNDYKVKITSTINVSNNDSSDNNFAIPVPSFTVVSPDGGENWTRGTTKNIRWNSTESPGTYVKIELLKAGVLNRVIISSTLNDGSHPWLIPATLAPGNDYKVKITSTINASNNDTSDDNFVIPVPSFTVVSPDGGENWTRGTNKIINWNSTESPGTYVKIELLKAGVLNRVIVASTLNDGSHPWLIPATQIPGNDYKMRVTSTANASNKDTSDNNFTIPAPSITVVSPNGGENWTRGTSKIINWNSTESPGTYVKIELLKAGILNRVIVASTLNDGSHPWLIPATQTIGSDYRVKITSNSNISNTDTGNNDFTIGS
ncbi:MAG: NosD domain-containing protein [Candidatus Methanoperedens sp.]